MRDYDPIGDAERDRQDRSDDDLLDTTNDYQAALAIVRARYHNTDEFEQAQRKFDRAIDEDRLAKVKARAAEADGSE